MSDKRPPIRNAFGTLVGRVNDLPWPERVTEIQRNAGSLMAGRASPAIQQWAGSALFAHFERGVPLDAALGLVPPPGCRSMHDHVRRARSDRLLVAFATAVGNDRRALRILRGNAVCPDAARQAYDALLACGHPLPTGPNAITRSRHHIALSSR